MALTVNFWNFSKRANSTAIPVTDPLDPSYIAPYTASCVLKADCSILAPVIEIGAGMSFNPSAYCYAQIPSYSRYYWVTDWEWSEGRWFASLRIDPLASWRTAIGSANKYILRSAHDHNDTVIDTFYPTKERYNVGIVSHTFSWSNDFAAGRFVLGVINGSGTSLTGTTEYYILTLAELRAFMEYVFPQDLTQLWSGLSGMTEYVYKSIYDPLQFIVSCKFFPFTFGGEESPVQICFGNFESTEFAEPLGKASTWPTFTHDYIISSDWLQRAARDRSEPYVNLYYFLNPFGIIPISTSDFTLTSTLRVKIIPDLISGNATIQLYNVINGVETMIGQQSGTIGFDINLTAINRDLSSIGTALINGAIAAGTGMMGPELGAVSMAGEASAIISAGQAFHALHSPTISANLKGSPSLAGLDGRSRLYVRRQLFVDENNAEFGRPLYADRTISAIPGFIKCGDAEFSAAGAMQAEIEQIGEAFTGGFFYE